MGLNAFGFVSHSAILCSITVTTLFAAQNRVGSHQSEKNDVLYANQNMKTVRIKLLNDTTGMIKSLELKLDENDLKKKFNITIDQINDRELIREPGGEYVLPLPGGQKIPVEFTVEEVINFINSQSQMNFTMSTNGFMRRTLKDLEGEESMKIEPLPTLSWPELAAPCRIINGPIIVSIMANKLSIKVNNETIHEETKVESDLKSMSDIRQGLFLVVFNPWTCKQTFTQIFRTFDFGFFRELIWTLDNIPIGRFVILASLGTGSLKLDAARNKLSSLGSSWAEFFLHRDCWLTAGYSRGQIVTEVLIPNLGNIFTSGSPFVAEFAFLRADVSPASTCYSGWPSGPEWEARRVFCDSNDGYKGLCDCERPFQIPSSQQRGFNESLEESDLRIPMIIVAGNRTIHLSRLLESIGNQKGVTKEMLLIVTDGDWETTRQLAFILGVQILFHRTPADSPTAGRIAVNLQFGLYHAQRLFSRAKYFVVLEDDLVLAPDFYAYMRHFAPIFEMDTTIFCVSAFNHLSYPHTSKDPSQVYRVRTFPAYGWMVSRKIAEYIIPKFLPGKLSQDWDYFMGSELISKRRETVIPDINRSYHWATKGIHTKGSLFAEESYLSRNLNQEPVVSYMPLKSVLRKNYEKDFYNLIREAESITVNEDLTGFSSPLREGGLYKTFVRKKRDSDDSGFRIIGEMIGIWTMDARDHHNHAWRLSYKDATLFVIGVPLSRYRKLMGSNDTYLIPKEKVDFIDHLNNIYSTVRVVTHFNASQLPNFFYINEERSQKL